MFERVYAVRCIEPVLFRELCCTRNLYYYYLSMSKTSEFSFGWFSVCNLWSQGFVLFELERELCAVYKWPWCIMGQKVVFLFLLFICVLGLCWIWVCFDMWFTLSVYILQAKWNMQYMFAFTADFVNCHLLLFKSR